MNGRNVWFCYHFCKFAEFYKVCVDGVAILDQLCDSNYEFNNDGSQPNSPAVVYSQEGRNLVVEMWTWRKAERVYWKDRVTNEEGLGRAGEKRSCLVSSRAGRVRSILYAENTR